MGHAVEAGCIRRVVGPTMRSVLTILGPTMTRVPMMGCYGCKRKGERREGGREGGREGEREGGRESTGTYKKREKGSYR